MMASEFSASLMLAGMDYIAPSETCTLPTRLQLGDKDAGSVLRHTAMKETVKITLQDCLACSGCVTTAETILVTSQSREEILKTRAADPNRHFLITISDQSAASIAAYLNVDARRVFRLLSGFFRSILGARYVADLRWAQRISVEKTAEEYCRRLQHSKDTLPMIVSACPGWVCYCEKQGSAVLPLLCSVMSPQGIAGSYAKALQPQLCHISVQPCFDRKLEATRDVSPTGERYTDFVLSTQEILEWILEADALLPWDSPLDSDYEPLPTIPLQESDRVIAAVMEGSGGYHRFAMQHVAYELHHALLSPDSIQYEVKRNANHQLATAPENPNEVYCVAYGFQQIQNIMRGIKRKLPSIASYTFIEMMACPDGCLNGGGQLRSSGTAVGTETLTKVRARFKEYLFPNGDAKNERPETEKPLGPGVTDEAHRTLYFSLSAFKSAERSFGSSLWSCVFHDRQKDFEATLNNGGVQSLKW